MAEDTGFADGFNAVHTGVPVKAEHPEPEPAKPEKEPEPDGGKPGAADVPEPEPEQEIVPGFSASQVKALLAKAGEVDALRKGIDTLSGRVGTVLQEVKSLKTKAPEPEIDEAAFIDDYPQFAGFTDKRMAGMYEELNKVKAQLDERTQAIEMRFLTRDHPDAGETIKSSEYAMWLATQTPEFQEVANSTESAYELGQVLTAYKEFSSKSSTAGKKRERLENAVVPTGVTPGRRPEPTEQDDFLAGWARVAGRK